MVIARKIGQAGFCLALGAAVTLSPALLSRALADSGYQPYYYVVPGQAQQAVPMAQVPQPAEVSSTPVQAQAVAAPVAASTAYDVANVVTPEVSAPAVVPTPVNVAPVAVSAPVVPAVAPVVIEQPRIDVAMQQPVTVQDYRYAQPYAQPEVRVSSVPRRAEPLSAKPKEEGAKDPMTLGTMGGLDGTLMASMYHYREIDLMNLVGFKGGAQLQATGKYNDMFFTADVRYASGTSNYHGGAQDSSGNELFAIFTGQNPENMWDIRGYVGRDFMGSKWAFSPYLGFGYRYFFADDRAASFDPTGTTVVLGYRRENQLYYSPIGFKVRYRVLPQSRIAAMFEYDHVWSGLQTSFLTDAGATDFNNHQGSGRGWRGELMWETPTWSIGPFANYWNIDSSDVKILSETTGAIEPHNWTYEVGLQFRYHLLNF